MVQPIQPVTVYEDERVRVLHRAGDTRFTLVTFSPVDFWKGRRAFWAQPLCRRKNINVLGVVALENNWFPEASTRPALAAMRGRLSGPVDSFGYSQGGYGALKYAASLGTVAAIGLCPQYSINPKKAVVSIEYRKYFSDRLHGGMEITEADRSGRVVILYDPKNRHDSEHTRLILAQMHGPAELVRLHYLQHRVADLLDEHDAMFDFVAACAFGQDLSPTRSRLRMLKKNSAFYRVNLAKAVLRHGRPLQALSILRTASEMMPRSDVQAASLLEVTLAEARKAAGVLAPSGRRDDDLVQWSDRSRAASDKSSG